MKKIYWFGTIASVAIIVFGLSYVLSFNDETVSPELTLYNTSLLGQFKSKSIAASCGFGGAGIVKKGTRPTGVGHPDEFRSCTATCRDGNRVPGTSQCGGPCQPIDSRDCDGTDKGCQNGAINPPRCNQCPAGSTMQNGQCTCSNGANNPPQCNRCPGGQAMQNGQCGCRNDAINPPQCNRCPIGASMQNDRCRCDNNADINQQCNVCRPGQTFNQAGQCVNGCEITNACGQKIQGTLQNGQCTAPSNVDPNESCIIDFNVSSGTVNPNGSVEFSWKLAELPSNIKQVCGFVDLTTPTPRPIPGLQNLIPSLDRTRINNIQSTTRFCLVCQFYDLLKNDAFLGEAVRHQWVRVLRIGEN